MAKSIYLIAGEASGDQLGAGLMRALKSMLGDKNVHFHGVGGEQMTREGLNSLFPYHELSLMGFAEVVPHIMRLTARISLVCEDIYTKHPDVVITIDSPGFNFRVAKRIREHGVGNAKLIHYVAPTVWAYKPERAHKCATLFDHMMVLLPFEPPFFENEGLATTFVGHPVAYQSKGDAAAFREKYKLPEDANLICLMPGSRENEIKRHMPIFASAILELARELPKLVMVLPVAERLLPLMAGYFAGCPFRTILTGDMTDKTNALAASQGAIVKSGTVALEVAQAGVPHVVAYRANPLSMWLVRRMVKIPYANLINLLSEQEVIPELIQEDCTSHLLAETLRPLLFDDVVRNVQRLAAKDALAQLKLPAGRHPSEAAAEVVLSVMGT